MFEVSLFREFVQRNPEEAAHLSEHEARAFSEIQRIERALRRAADEIVCILLVGSTSRGEGQLRRAGSDVAMSDIDVLVVTRDFGLRTRSILRNLPAPIHSGIPISTAIVPLRVFCRLDSIEMVEARATGLVVTGTREWEERAIRDQPSIGEASRILLNRMAELAIAILSKREGEILRAQEKLMWACIEGRLVSDQTFEHGYAGRARMIERSAPALLRRLGFESAEGLLAARYSPIASAMIDLPDLLAEADSALAYAISERAEPRGTFEEGLRQLSRLRAPAWQRVATLVRARRTLGLIEACRLSSRPSPKIAAQLEAREALRAIAQGSRVQQTKLDMWRATPDHYY